MVKFLTGQEGWLTNRLILVIPIVARCSNPAEPPVRASRSMVCRRQAADVAGDPGMNDSARRMCSTHRVSPGRPAAQTTMVPWRSISALLAWGCLPWCRHC